jgi:kinesin family protein 18/19
MRDLFDRIEETKDKYNTHLEMSMVELYNEQIRDLLSDNFPVTQTGGLKLLEVEKERVTIADVTIKEPKTVEEVLELVMLGNERRSTSSTNANNQSSRSHAVLQINVTRSNRAADVDMDRETVLQDTSSATLSIVDLAGSERASATLNMGTRMKEGAKINQSLLALSSCISALCAAQRARSRPHVPYRNSKLTRLLKFSLGGNCRTVMIVCVSPSSRDMEDTSNTLTWANKAKDVKTRVTRNVGGQEVSTRQYLEKIAEQTQRIKALEAMLDSQKSSAESVSLSKLDDVRKRIADLINPISAKIEGALGDIRQGAELRARWDGVQLGVDKVTKRRDDLGTDRTDEKAMCEQILEQYTHFNNREVQVKVRKESEQVTSIEQALRSAEERSIPGSDAASIADLKLQIKLQRFHYEAAVAEAREAAYRSTLEGVQDGLAACAVAFTRVKAALSQETMAQSHLEALEDEILSTFTNLANPSGVQARPQPFRLPALSLASSVSSYTTPAVSEPKTSSPAVKRVLAASEKKGGYVVGGGSPRKVRNKTLRFAPDDDIHFYSPGSSQSIINIDDMSADWEEEQDKVKPLAAPSFARGGLRGFAMLQTAAAGPSGTASAAAPTAPAASAASSDVASEVIPEWKKHRMLMAKAGPLPGTSSAEDSSLSTPEAAQPLSKASSLGLGKPSRPPSRPTSVLGELHQIPAVRSALSSSTLMQPTAASAARAAAQSTDKLAVPTPSPHAKPTTEPRRSSVTRRERSKLHKSAAPYTRKSAAGSPNGSPNTSISPRGGSSSAVLNASTTRALTRPGTVRMRPSALDANANANTSINMSGDTSVLSAIARPSLRHSVSISTLPNGQLPSLRTRPSMQHLGSGSRPAWK